MNLHYSQTIRKKLVVKLDFSTIWIYTTLKHMDVWIKILTCFSTIWIYTTLKPLLRLAPLRSVFLPYEFTLLSNAIDNHRAVGGVFLPYEFTLLSNRKPLRCRKPMRFSTIWIYTTLKLKHPTRYFLKRFSTIWIYTTLKQVPSKWLCDVRFSTVWIYTTLKLF